MSEWLENNKTKNKVFEEAQHKKIRFHKAMNKPISKNLFKDFANNRKKTYWLVVFSHILLYNILKYNKILKKSTNICQSLLNKS